MKPKIEYDECLRDSPKFRKFLEEEESSIEHLEQKLERTLKLCTIMVDSGKEYVKNQCAFATSLWDLHSHFKDDKSAQNALNKIINCFQEMNKFQTILLDQASCIILKNITSFIKTEIKAVKEQRTHFCKVSETYDAALTRNAQANKNRLVDVNDAVNTLSASSSCFRHMALDYVYSLTRLQSRKMHEILSTLLTYYQACNTFYHQGYDLCTDFEEFFKGLSNDITVMQGESMQLEKMMQNRHLSVSQFAENQIAPMPPTLPTALNDSAAAASSQESAAPLNQYEGYLFKRTSKGFKSWNRRWFYLRDNQLLYVKRDRDAVPTVMEEDLRICTVRPINESDRRFCFEVISPMKNHILQADSAESLNAWIAALHNRIDAAIHDHREHDKTLNIFSNSLPGAKKIRKINCEQFYKIPGNGKCCDCGSPEPRWASINLGITLCIACSGVHRSLGVHYSKVRSLTLDAWEPEILKVMMELGNDVVNDIYEATYSDTTMEVAPDAAENSMTSVQRATSDCDNAVREAWIKAKYVEKLFLLPISALCDKTLKSKRPNHMLDIVLSDSGWTVKRARRRKWKATTDKQSTVTVDKQSTDDSASGSELSIDSNRTTDDFSLGSDNDSTDDEDTEVDLVEDDVADLNADRLLYKATAAHNLPIMCYALASGASKNWANLRDSQRTPLHQAILSGSVTACEYLLLNGFQINVVDEQGYTSLHLATEKGYTAHAYLLLKHQAKHDIVAKNFKQPIDIAIEQANADIVTLLRLTRLNEEIGIEEHGTGEGDTYNDVMNDFSRFAVSQPHKLQRSKMPQE